MSLIKWEPFGELDRFFEDFPLAASTSRMGWDLAVDVYEKGGNVIAEMNLPGIEAGDVDITVDDGYLRITGTREEKKEEKDKHFFSREIRRGSFERAVRIPENVDEKNVKAEYEKGVLRVTMPKIEKPKPDKIEIKVKD